MVKADVVGLVSKTYSTDTIGQKVATETTTTVFCEVQSVTRSEFSAAGALGIRPSYTLITPLGNYSGQDEVEFRSKRYRVYRTYERGENVELYIEELTSDG